MRVSYNTKYSKDTAHVDERLAMHKAKAVPQQSKDKTTHWWLLSREVSRSAALTHRGVADDSLRAPESP